MVVSAAGAQPDGQVGLTPVCRIDRSGLPCPSAPGAGGQLVLRPSLVTGSRAETLRMISTYSQALVGTPHGWPYHPSTIWGPETPRPMITRLPPASASIVGVHGLPQAGPASWTTPKPNLMRVVGAAIDARGERGRTRRPPPSRPKVVSEALRPGGGSIGIRSRDPNSRCSVPASWPRCWHGRPSRRRRDRYRRLRR